MYRPRSTNMKQTIFVRDMLSGLRSLKYFKIMYLYDFLNFEENNNNNNNIDLLTLILNFEGVLF